MSLTSVALQASDVGRILGESGYDPTETAGLHAALLALITAGLDATPHPGSGHTLERWRLLAAVAAHDVALVKLVEGHLDALAIMAELGAETPEAGTTWGTWAAEPPDAQVLATPTGPGGALVLSGRKAWCSGVTVLSHGLLTCRGPAGERWLAAVAMHQPGVFVERDGWHAVGMAATQSVGVSFDAAPAKLVGGDGDYLRRQGFWQGGAGIAACWWGGSLGISETLRRVTKLDPHAAAHLGAVETALAATAALLRETAHAYDETGAGETARTIERAARLARASAEATAHLVLDHVGRATGAGPLCLDGDHARRVADLTVFVRQSHAERDLAALGVLADTATGL